MGAIDGATLAGRVLRESPLVFAAAGVIATAATLVEVASVVPLVGVLVGLVYVFVEPYFASGFLGVVDDAIDGPVTAATFVERAGEHYGDLLVARLVLFGPLVVYEILASGVSTALVTFLHSVGGAGGAPSIWRTVSSDVAGALSTSVDPLSVVLLTAGVLALGLVAVAYVLLQFYPAAIVVGDAGALESFRYSYEFVREHPVSVLGYTAISALGGVVLALPTAIQLVVTGGAPGGGFVAGSSIESTVVGAIVYAPAFLVAKTVVVCLLRTYYVCFVRSTLGPTRRVGPPD